MRKGRAKKASLQTANALKPTPSLPSLYQVGAHVRGFGEDAAAHAAEHGDAAAAEAVAADARHHHVVVVDRKVRWWFTNTTHEKEATRHRRTVRKTSRRIF